MGLENLRSTFYVALILNIRAILSLEAFLFLPSRIHRSDSFFLFQHSEILSCPQAGEWDCLILLIEKSPLLSTARNCSRSYGLIRAIFLYRCGSLSDRLHCANT